MTAVNEVYYSIQGKCTLMGMPMVALYETREEFFNLLRLNSPKLGG